MMRTLLPAALLLVFASVGSGAELWTTVGLEARYFVSSPTHPEQKRHNASTTLGLEFFHTFESGSSITLEPFLRLDSSDSQRNHGDLRIANYLHLADDWQLTIGMDKVFWGVTEFVHLVDIINQTDMLESLDGEEKLGQPMLHLLLNYDWGTLETFLLPYFRVREFPGTQGRLRGAIRIDDDEAQFESSGGRHHLDVAMRYSHSFERYDLGLSQFIGTSREPVLLEERQSNTLTPYYQQISQTAIDLQYLKGSWLYKLEALYRFQKDGNNGAFISGFEYTFVSPLGSSLDLGLLGEYVHDDRSAISPVPFDNDLMLGIRISLYDVSSTEILLGLVKDLEYNSTFFTVEASRRIHDKMKLELTGSLLKEIDENDPAHPLHRDSFIQLKLLFYL